MNFHEYQAKELFAQYNIPVPNGLVARTAEEAVAAAKELENSNLPNRWHGLTGE